VSDDTAQPAPKNPKSGLLPRIISALVLIPPVILAIYAGYPYFDIMIGIGVLILCWEWYTMCGPKPAWLLAGLVYIGAPSYALIYIRSDIELGYETVLWVFVLVWATDILAYAAGRTFGGPKLAPAISPNKTWSGLLGGMSGAAVAGIITALAFDHSSVIPLALISAGLGAFSQGGDLLESWVKRKFGKKDSGSLIPGHGGLFDRVDGLLAASLAVAAIDYTSARGSLLSWV
jgi:phosphatidate cytidylyltransferase